MTKPIKIIFTLSLLLNLALVGVSAGCIWKKAHHRMPFANTAPETQALFKETFAQNRERMRADIDAIRASRGALESIITAEPFDRAAYDTEVGKVLSVREGMNARRAEILGGVLEQLPQAEREKIVKKIVSKLTDDKPHGHRGKRPSGDTPDNIPRPPPPAE